VGKTNVRSLIRKEKTGLIVRLPSERSTRYFLDWIELDDPVGIIPIRRRAINASCPKDVFQVFPIAANRHKTCDHPRVMSKGSRNLRSIRAAGPSAFAQVECYRSIKSVFSSISLLVLDQANMIEMIGSNEVLLGGGFPSSDQKS